MSNDIRCKGLVLRRTNFGEADRVVNFLTERGVIAAIAKGVRREKSKMAGAIELFCIADLTFHEGRNNRLHILTSAKMLEAYQNIVYDLTCLELASTAMKRVAAVAENSTGPEYFLLLKQVLSGLNTGVSPELVEVWFWFNLAKTDGEQINLVQDTAGQKLDAYKTYIWNANEKALQEQLGGNIGVNEIKLMRLILSSPLENIAKINNVTPMLPTLMFVAKAINN